MTHPSRQSTGGARAPADGKRGESNNRITRHYAPDNYNGQLRKLNRLTVAGDIPVGVDGRSSTAIKGDSSACSETVVLA